MAEILVQQIAQGLNRRHEEVRGASQHNEFFRYFERCPSIPVGIIWSGLIHESSAAFAVLSDDRIEARDDRRAGVGPLFAGDKIRVIRITALDELELPLDRCLVADEEKAAAVPRHGLAGLHLGPERDAAAE